MYEPWFWLWNWSLVVRTKLESSPVMMSAMLLGNEKGSLPSKLPLLLPLMLLLEPVMLLLEPPMLLLEPLMLLLPLKLLLDPPFVLKSLLLIMVLPPLMLLLELKPDWVLGCLSALPLPPMMVPCVLKGAFHFM